MAVWRPVVSTLLLKLLSIKIEENIVDVRTQHQPNRSPCIIRYLRWDLRLRIGNRVRVGNQFYPQIWHRPLLKLQTCMIPPPFLWKVAVLASSQSFLLVHRQGLVFNILRHRLHLVAPKSQIQKVPHLTIDCYMSRGAVRELGFGILTNTCG